MPRLAAALTCVALAAAGAGCGGDDEPSDTTEPPLPTLPESSPAPDDETETGGDSTDPATETAPSTEPAPTEQSDPSGGAPAPAPDPPPDSPENDVAPEPGSPESRFEEACDQNPAACG